MSLSKNLKSTYFSPSPFPLIWSMLPTVHTQNPAKASLAFQYPLLPYPVHYTQYTSSDGSYQKSNSIFLSLKRLHYSQNKDQILKSQRPCEIRVLALVSVSFYMILPTMLFTFHVSTYLKKLRYNLLFLVFTFYGITYYQIPSFEMYSLGFLVYFPCSASTTTIQFQTVFFTPVKNPLAVTLPFPLPPRPTSAITNLCPISKDLPLFDISYKWDHMNRMWTLCLTFFHLHTVFKIIHALVLHSFL